MTSSESYDVLIYIGVIIGLALSLRKVWTDFGVGDFINWVIALRKVPILVEHIEKDENIYHVPRNWRNWVQRQIATAIDAHVTVEHRRKELEHEQDP